MQDRRKRQRRRVLKGAKLHLDKLSSRDCVVRDLTEAGAGVELPHTIDLPDAVDLSLDSDGRARRARLVWRKINKTGVEFI